MPIVRFEKRDVEDRTILYPVIKGHPRFWQDKSNHVAVIEANKITSIADYRKYIYTGYRRANTYGFLRELPLDAERTTKGLYSTEEEIRAALLEYQVRRDVPSGLIKTIYINGFHNLLDERFPVHVWQESDVFYLMRLAEDPFGRADGSNRVAYKVGVTSFHLGTQREEIFRRAGYQFFDAPRYWYTQKATAVERYALKLGERIDYDESFDGSTEHRYFAPKDVEALLAYIAVQQATAIYDFKVKPKGYKKRVKRITGVIKYNNGFAARENRHRRIATFRTKFDAVLCKALHLDGGQNREFAMAMTKFRNTPMSGGSGLCEGCSNERQASLF